MRKSDSFSPNSKNQQHRNEEEQSREEEIELQSALHFAIGQICLSVEQEMELLEKSSSPSHVTTNTTTNHETQTHPPNSHAPTTTTTDTNTTMQSNPKTRMTTEAIRTLTEITFQYATTCLANDLIRFSQHANRRTITVEDVKLVARKETTKLLPALESFASSHKETPIMESKNDSYSSSSSENCEDSEDSDSIPMHRRVNHSRSKSKKQNTSTRRTVKQKKHGTVKLKPKHYQKKPSKNAETVKSRTSNMGHPTKNQIVEIDMDSGSSSSTSSSKSNSELSSSSTSEMELNSESNSERDLSIKKSFQSSRGKEKKRSNIDLDKSDLSDTTLEDEKPNFALSCSSSSSSSNNDVNGNDKQNPFIEDECQAG